MNISQPEKRLISPESLWYGSLIGIAIFGLWFLRHAIVKNEQRSKANVAVIDKVKVAETNIESKQYDVVASILAEAYAIESATNKNIVDACMSKVNLAKEAILMAEFKSWVEFRKYRDAGTLSMYNSYFGWFLATLRIESITPQQLRELDDVEQLFSTTGFDMFLKHFESALLEVYNTANFKSNHETELRKVMNSR